MSEELSRYEAGGAVDLVKDPERVLIEAKKAAEALIKVVSGKPKKVVINGEQYLEFEDWQTLGRFYGLTVKVDHTGPVVIEGARGWESHASVLNREGEVISGADSMCLNDEEKWSSKPKYEYQYILKDGTKTSQDPPPNMISWIPNPNKPGKSMPKKERVKLGDEPVPSFQLRSMAQTRACAKAFRNVLAWVVVLAGYRPTPAEEMGPTDRDDIPTAGEEVGQTKQSTPPNEPTQDKPKGSHSGELISIQEKVSEKNQKPYWTIKYPPDKEAWTYDPEIAKAAINAVKVGAMMTWEVSGKGQMINLRVAG